LDKVSSYPLIVGICGAKQHGKGTIAAALTRFGFKEINFADALKRACSEAFAIPLDVFYDNARKESPLTEFGYPNESPRSILQHVGTELFRSRWPNIWIDTWKRMAAGSPRVVVSDMRFPNELEAVRAMKGYVIRVTRPGYGAADAHASEAHYSAFDVDWDVTNEGAPEDLQMKAFIKIANVFHLV